MGTKPCVFAALMLTATQSVNGQSHKARGDVDARDNVGRTQMMYSAEIGDLKSMRALLARGAKVNAQDFFGRTALSEATAGGQRESVAYLLANGANMDIKGQEGKTPYQIAKQGYFDSITELF